MSEARLNVAFLWHQHQPFYRNSRGFYQMPWVRFHGTKDYLDMLLILKEFPEVKQMVNLVPSLLLQIQDYVEKGARDNIWLLTEKPTTDLTPDDKLAILNNFFLANIQNMVKPYPRYYELYLKYRSSSRQAQDVDRIKFFDDQDFLDLQVWYNLAWIGEESRQRPIIRKLFKKQGHFSETDKKSLMQETVAILGEIIPLHKNLWETGQIELSTSPFYHPILPLLIDHQVALKSDPNVTLPSLPFSHPEDAGAQLQKGLNYFEKLFGRKPVGVWPPEGGVSEEVAEIMANYHIRWMATDEAVLAQSLNQDFHHTCIYRPYLFTGKQGAIHVFFRDHYLSDAIGFVYCNWDADRAVSDFMSRLHSIRQQLLQEVGEPGLSNYIVSIILDGENCWEYYVNNGRVFLRKLYQQLSKDPLIQTMTYGQFLSQAREIPSLERLHPGSWINGNFNIWIGSEEDNRAWVLLKKARDFLATREKEGLLGPQTLEQAWEKIYIAEGSDWCWWYGDEHSSSHDIEFDQLYREHLMEVYQILGKEIPTALYQTIKRSHFDRFKSIRPVNFVHPIIDGRSTHYFEWTGAAIYDGSKVPQTAMHQVSRLLEKVFVGFDEANFYFRLDFFTLPDPLNEYVLTFKTPRHMTIVISPLRGVIEKFERQDGSFVKSLLEPRFKLQQVLEVAISFSGLGVRVGERVGFQIHIKQNNQLVEIFPHINIIEVEVPDEDFELREWLV